MNHWSWKEGFIFAFARRLLSVEGSDPVYEMCLSEKLGLRILKPFYWTTEFISKNIRLPLVICFFTLLAAVALCVVFYDVHLLIILEKFFPVQSVRFFLFLYVELNLLAIGGVAFGRFYNKELIRLWKEGRLVAVMPGDYESKKTDFLGS